MPLRKLPDLSELVSSLMKYCFQKIRTLNKNIPQQYPPVSGIMVTFLSARCFSTSVSHLHRTWTVKAQISSSHFLSLSVGHMWILNVPLGQRQAWQYPADWTLRLGEGPVAFQPCHGWSCHWRETWKEGGKLDAEDGAYNASFPAIRKALASAFPSANRCKPVHLSGRL